MYEPQFRCRSNGVPILSHEDIESDAEMFIRDFDPDVLNNPKEVNIEEFAEFYLGLTPEYNNPTHCGLILGRMVFNDSNKVPVYDADAKRAEYVSATDDEAVDALLLLTRTEGIIPAIESSHALAEVIKRAPKMDKDKVIIVNVSGRGDKDVAAIAEYLENNPRV